MTAQGTGPLVTLALFTYNQEAYAEEALQAALAQTYSPLEIIVSDDCSTDGTFNLIQQLASAYDGPHRVVVRRNDRNLGFIRHVCEVVRGAHGELIFAAAGDDVSVPERVAKVVRTWLDQGRPSGSIFSRFKTVDEQGTVRSNPTTHPMLTYTLADRPEDILQSLSVGTLGCAHAWTRDIFQTFGDIDGRVIHEDVAISLRSLLIGRVIFMPDELVLYRLTSGSLSRVAFADHRDRIRKMARYWNGRVANHEQLRSDTRIALQRGLVHAEGVAWMKRNLDANEDIARRNARFFGGGVRDRLALLATSWNKVPVAQILKWLAITVFPQSYALRIRK